MQAKQKVTLYLSPELHRRLKIRAAIDSEPMSELAERALVFYLNHSEVVDEIEASYGRTHKVYECPECTASLALRQGEMVSISSQPGILESEPLPVGQDQRQTVQGEEELVPCY